MGNRTSEENYWKIALCFVCLVRVWIGQTLRVTVFVYGVVWRFRIAQVSILQKLSKTNPVKTLHFSPKVPYTMLHGVFLNQDLFFPIYLISLISTLLLSALPDDVLLLATGLDSPNPEALRFDTSTPFNFNQFIIDLARLKERSSFSLLSPSLSVCPTISNLIF